MLKPGRLTCCGDVWRLPVGSVGILCVRYVTKAKRKTKHEGSKHKRRPQKTPRNSPRKTRSNHSNVDHVIEQSQDALSFARPFSVYHPPGHITPEIADDIVLYKDDDIVAINKPSGYSVHGKTVLDDILRKSFSGPEVVHDLSNYMENWCYGLKDPPHLAHRTDKVTSGILLLTRHADAARRFAELFRNRKIEKSYLALCIGVPLRYHGSIKLPIAIANIGEKSNTHRAVLIRDADVQYSEQTIGRTMNTLQIAQTDYRVLGQAAGGRCCLMELNPKTGFQHQLRVHLSDGLNTPIVGDKKFAGPVLRRQANVLLRRRMKLIDRAICKNVTYLHAYQLTIPEYTKNKNHNLTITAPLPAYFIHSLQKLNITLPPGHSLEMATWKVT